MCRKALDYEGTEWGGVTLGPSSCSHRSDKTPSERVKPCWKSCQARAAGCGTEERRPLHLLLFLVPVYSTCSTVTSWLKNRPYLPLIWLRRSIVKKHHLIFKKIIWGKEKQPVFCGMLSLPYEAFHDFKLLVMSGVSEDVKAHLTEQPFLQKEIAGFLPKKRQNFSSFQSSPK